MTAIETSPIAAHAGADEKRAPYVGPRAFRRDEHLHGRDVEAREVSDVLLAERILLCHGPSGGGKTSLVQALLIPRMSSKFAVLGPTKVGRAAGGTRDGTPVNRYVMSALMELEQERIREESEEWHPGQGEPKTMGPDDLARMTIAQYVDRREAALPHGQRVLLIFDQFEEILTLDGDDVEAKLEFFRQVGMALQPLHRWALFVIDEQYVAALDHYVHLVPTHLAQHYALELLDPDEAKEAIARPAEDAGIPFTDEAVDRLVEKLRLATRPGSPSNQLGRYVEPVQLQVVCTQLWRNLPAGTTEIAREHVERIGDVDTALAAYYDDTVRLVSEKTGVGEKAIREWIGSALIHGDVRAHGAVGGEAAYGLTGSAMEGLSAAYLIRLDQQHTSACYELAHDRLIAPIKESNARWFTGIMKPVERYAETWNATGRRDSGLLRGRALRDARTWARQHPDEILSRTRVDEFLARSASRQRTTYLWTALLVVVALSGIGFGYRPLRQAIHDYRQRRTWETYGLEREEIRLANKKVHVTYFTRPQDDTIEAAIRKLGFATELYTSPATRPDSVLPNAVKYGRGVDSTAVKLVVFALKRVAPAIRLQYICPEDEGIDRNEIQVRYARNWQLRDTLPLELIRTDGRVRGRLRGRVMWNCPD